MNQHLFHDILLTGILKTIRETPLLENKGRGTKYRLWIKYLQELLTANYTNQQLRDYIVDKKG